MNENMEMIGGLVGVGFFGDDDAFARENGGDPHIQSYRVKLCFPFGHEPR